MAYFEALNQCNVLDWETLPSFHGNITALCPEILEIGQSADTEDISAELVRWALSLPDKNTQKLRSY